MAYLQSPPLDTPATQDQQCETEPQSMDSQPCDPHNNSQVPEWITQKFSSEASQQQQVVSTVARLIENHGGVLSSECLDSITAELKLDGDDTQAREVAAWVLNPSNNVRASVVASVSSATTTTAHPEGGNSSHSKSEDIGRVIGVGESPVTCESEASSGEAGGAGGGELRDDDNDSNGGGVEDNDDDQGESDDDDDDDGDEEEEGEGGGARLPLAAAASSSSSSSSFGEEFELEEEEGDLEETETGTTTETNQTSTMPSTTGDKIIDEYGYVRQREDLARGVGRGIASISRQREWWLNGPWKGGDNIDPRHAQKVLGGGVGAVRCCSQLIGGGGDDGGSGSEWGTVWWWEWTVVVDGAGWVVVGGGGSGDRWCRKLLALGASGIALLVLFLCCSTTACDPPSIAPHNQTCHTCTHTHIIIIIIIINNNNNNVHQNFSGANARTVPPRLPV
jgi:hypothetical protein